MPSRPVNHMVVLRRKGERTEGIAEARLSLDSATALDGEFKVFTSRPLDSVAATLGTSRARTSRVAAPQNRLTAARTHAERRNPSDGTRKNALPRIPATAPDVLAA